MNNINTVKRVLVQDVLAQLNITMCGAPSEVLYQLVSIVKSRKTLPYMFLWTGDGECIAHGMFPQLENMGSVFNDNNAVEMASLIPNLNPIMLQEGILTVTSESLSIGRSLSYEWIGGLKNAYVIRILIGGKVYVFGA